MITRVVIAFIALPGMVAILVPVFWLWLSEHTMLVLPLGLLVLVIGFAALLWCVRDFYVSGKGTLAPWTPPAHLVTIGLYRYSRNPMYVAVEVILFGWAISFGSFDLFIYAIFVLVAFHLRIVISEEPYLARAYGQQWQQYAQQVRR